MSQNVSGQKEKPLHRGQPMQGQVADTPIKRFSVSSSSSNFGFDLYETILGSREGNLSEVMAFAASRAQDADANDSGPASTSATIPAPSL